MSKQKIFVIIAFIGVLYCLLAYHGVVDFVCHSQGCKIYKGYNFLGMSFYLWGALAFSLYVLLFLLQKYSFLYLYFLLFCFSFEIGLLLYQAIYLPCLSCLIVGSIWAILFYLTFFKQEKNFFSIKNCKILLGLWIFLFCFNLLSYWKGAIQPWPIYGNNTAPVKIFFSPTCPYCKKTIKEMVEKGTNASDIALYPVAKSKKDRKKICLLACSLKRGSDINNALNLCLSTTCPNLEKISIWEQLLLELNMFRNKIVLGRMGVNTIPVIISHVPLLPLKNKSKSIGCSITGEGICGKKVQDNFPFLLR